MTPRSERGSRICAEALSASIGGPGRAPGASAGEIRTSQDFPRPGAGQLIGPIVPRVVAGAMMGAQTAPGQLGRLLGRHVISSEAVPPAPSAGQSSSFRNSAGVKSACRRIELRVPRLMVPCWGITTTRPKGIWPVGLRRCIPVGRCRRERLVRAARGPWGFTGTGELRGVYLRIVGELRKPGVRVFAASVRSMQRHPGWGRDPAIGTGNGHEGDVYC
jgi:hypothetical protein